MSQEIRIRYNIRDRAANYLKKRLLIEAYEIASLGQDDLQNLESHLSKEFVIHSENMKKLDNKELRSKLRGTLRKSKHDLIESFHSNLVTLFFLFYSYQKNNSYDGALAKIFPKNRTKKGHKKWENKTMDEFKDAIFSDSEGFRREIFSENHVYDILNCIFNDGYKLDVNDRIYRLRIANIILQRGLDVILSFIDPKYQSFVRDDFKKIKDLSAVLTATYPN